ncbi:MAG: hypothetical protein ABSE86_06380 [Bryobacteraceae bacterium]
MKRRDAVVLGIAAGSAVAQKVACPSYFAAGLKARWTPSKDYSPAMPARLIHLIPHTPA